MSFKLWLEGSVLAHVSGPSGSGKTTLANLMAKDYPNIVFKDLDDFDDQAVSTLGWTDVRKNDYTDEMLKELAELRQKLMDEFVRNSVKSIIFVGHHTEGDHVLDINTSNRFLLDVDAKTAAMRAWKRSQKEDPKHRRSLTDLPADEKEAQGVIDFLKTNGYRTMSVADFSKWLVGRY